MLRLLWMVVWLGISVFAFFLVGRADTRRERTGRRLVGIAAILVAAALVTPTSASRFNVGDALALGALVLGGLLLATGLYLAIPPSWRRRTSHDPNTSAQ
jgi:hypothetical protein